MSNYLCTRKQSADIEHVEKVTVNIIVSDANTGFCKFSYNRGWIISDPQPLEERLEKLCRTFADKTLKSRHTNMFTTYNSSYATRGKPNFYIPN